MNRRTYIKQVVAAAGGLVALPSWAEGWVESEIRLGDPLFTATESSLLASVADTIIPAGNDVGALSVGVDVFLQKLFQDCYGEDVQANVRVQLKGLDDAAMARNSKSFVSCDQLQRQELLLKLSSSTDKAEKDFFDLVKSETIRGFRTSKDVMMRYLEYKVVPGHYYGCVDVNV